MISRREFIKNSLLVIAVLNIPFVTEDIYADKVFGKESMMFDGQDYLISGFSEPLKGISYKATSFEPVKISYWDGGKWIPIT